VDDESDLRALALHDLTGTQTGRWLQESGVWSRLQLGCAALGTSSAG
jgi:hypothetical protein